MEDVPKAGPAPGIGLRDAIAIGAGGMVGGGIFPVLGLAVQVAGKGAYVSFGLAGIATLLTGYSYAKLAVRYPSRGGTVTFMNHALRGRFVPGSLSVLLWLAYFVMLSLYAYGFGAYMAALAGAAENSFLVHLLASLSIIGFTALNLTAPEGVARTQSLLVYVSVGALLLFIALGLMFVRGSNVSPAGFPGAGSILYGTALVYLTFEGFELIANAAEDVRNPEWVLPRAFFICIVFVGLIYVLVAIVGLGNLTPDAIVAKRDFAISVAARSFLGAPGFAMMSVAAVLATAGAINATLYGTHRFTYTLATAGELPHWFAQNLWRKPVVGLLTTAAATLVITNTLSLEGISMTGSGAFLIVFLATNFASYRLAGETGASPLLSLLGVIICGGCLVVLIYYAASTFPAQLSVLAAMLLIAGAVEAAEITASGWKKSEG